MSEALPTAPLARLLAIMARLRDPQQGCPWDKRQDFASIVPYTLEEAYEVADCIERAAWHELPGELGDLLFQVVFYAQIGKEQQLFDFDSICRLMCEKLIHRHPHVFADSDFADEAAVKANWEALKAQERAQQVSGPVSVLANIPHNLPALTRALKIQKRVARVGFDWPDLTPVIDKIHEELLEVQEELQQQVVQQPRVEEEVGDLLFAVVNLARHLKVDPERALRQANLKFCHRFTAVENELSKENKTPEQSNLREMDHLWQKVKDTY